MKRFQCKGRTKTGKRCKNPAKDGDVLCSVHANNKPTSAERERRIAKVLEKMVEGKSREVILQYSANRWNVESRTVDGYMADARKRINSDIEEKRSEIIGLAIRQFDDLYDRNYGMGEYKECRQVLESKIKFLMGGSTIKIKDEPKENPERGSHLRRVAKGF